MKKIVILGAGESGKGTAILAHKMGYDVMVSDSQAISAETKSQLDKRGIWWEEKNHSEDHLCSADIVMKSPGIPNTTKIVQAFRKAKIKIVSEIEFAAQYTSAKIIGITGSNGKTTTTKLVSSQKMQDFMLDWLATLASALHNKSPRTISIITCLKLAVFN